MVSTEIAHADAPAETVDAASSEAGETMNDKNFDGNEFFV
jgi:hypothetical protein